MGQMLENIQDRLKTSSKDIFTLILKVFTGAVLGLTLAIVGQEIIGYAEFAFILMIVVVTAAFVKVAKGWGLGGVLIFDLIAILIGILLRMYILIAPGA